MTTSETEEFLIPILMRQTRDQALNKMPPWQSPFITFAYLWGADNMWRGLLTLRRARVRCSCRSLWFGWRLQICPDKQQKGPRPQV